MLSIAGFNFSCGQKGTDLAFDGAETISRDIWHPVKEPLAGSQFTPPIFSPEGLNAARDLQNAQTIGDILLTAFPLAIAPLREPLSAFANYYHDFGSAILRADMDMSGQITNPRKIVSDWQPMTPLGAFREPLAQTVLFNQAIADGRSWRAQIFTYRSDLMPHGNALHTDQPEGAPFDLIGLAVSSNPTKVVPHKDELSILARSIFAPVLDLRLDDPQLQPKLADFNGQLFNQGVHVAAAKNVREQLREALVELAPGKLNIMTGMDIHVQADRVDPKRVCGKFVTNFNPYNNWSQPE